MNTLQDLIEKQLQEYDSTDAQLWADTVEELVSKGFKKGCFQDYAMIADIISVLSICENYIRRKEEK